MRPTLVLTPPPTPNGPLHLGHLSGPYIAADVAVRAARRRGEEVLAVGGLDVHQNYLVTKAQQQGRPVGEVLAHYSDLVRATFGLARISYEVMVSPATDAGYRRAVTALLGELVGSGAARVVRTTLLRCRRCRRTMHHAYVGGMCSLCGEGANGGACERCGAFTSSSDLLEPRCNGCGGAPEPFLATVPVLRLEDYRDRLVAWWSLAEVPARVWRLLGHYLSSRLPDIPLAYPSDWGIRTGDGLRVDVWVEYAVGLLYAVARELDGRITPASTAARCVQAWTGSDGYRHFFGVDNTFYYAVLTPALLAAAGVQAGTLRGLVVNEFYRLAGLKFSTSRNHAVWAHEFLPQEDPGLVRAYLCWDRPDRYGSDFSLDGFRAFARRYGAVLSAAGLNGAGLNGAGLNSAELDGAGLDGGGSATAARLAAVELERAEHALGFSGFDPALALRCLFSAARAEPRRVSDMLGAVLGTEVAGVQVAGAQAAGAQAAGAQVAGAVSGGAASGGVASGGAASGGRRAST